MSIITMKTAKNLFLLCAWFVLASHPVVAFGGTCCCTRRNDVRKGCCQVAEPAPPMVRRRTCCSQEHRPAAQRVVEVQRRQCGCSPFTPAAALAHESVFHRIDKPQACNGLSAIDRAGRRMPLDGRYELSDPPQPSGPPLLALLCFWRN